MHINSSNKFNIRNDFLPFHQPLIENEEIDAVVSTLKSGWLSTGPKVHEFEKSMSEYLGIPHCIALNSGTAALHLALKAIGLKENDEVLIPTNTFTSTGEVVTYFNAKPVLVDCTIENSNIYVNQIESKITKNTKAIMPVHFGGNPCEMDIIQNICKKYDLRLIEDAAHALTSKFQNNLIGTVGDITCFSFYATKNITTGEGGMAVTSNPEYAETIRKLSLHGITIDAWNRYAKKGSWFYEVSDAGFKYNMSDILASIGTVQIKKAELMLQKRTNIAKTYTDQFSNISAINLPITKPENRNAWHLYVIQIKPEQLKINRETFIDKLKEYNIGTSVNFIPLHRHPYYKNKFGYSFKEFPNSESIYRNSISLPIYPKMTAADVDYVIETIKHLISTYKK